MPVEQPVLDTKGGGGTQADRQEWDGRRDLGRTDRQTDRHASRQTEAVMGWKERFEVGQTDRHVGRQADRQTETGMGWKTGYG